MPTLQDIKDEVLTLHADMVGRVETLDKEQKARGEELTSKTGQMAAEYKTAIEGINARLNTITDQLEKARIEAARPPIDGKEMRKKSEHHAAFIKAMKNLCEVDRLTEVERKHTVYSYMPQEQKDLYAGDATSGGFFAATDFMDELQSYRLLVSAPRKICRVQSTSGERVQMPALANDASAYWASEQSSFTTSTDPSVGMITIPVHEMRGRLKVSEQNLEDSMFNLEDLIKTRLMLRFAQLEGQAFISGNGNGKPRGILNYPVKASSGYTGGSAGKNNVTDAVPYVPSGVAGNLTADSILNVFMDLKSAYAPNATYIFTRSTLNTIRLFKDSQNRPLWQPFAGGNLPAMIYDRPYMEMPDMPEIAANAYAVVVGDFSNYMIVDRITMNMRRLDELYAEAGLVGFIARMRSGGDVLIPEAFRILKCSVS